MTNNCVHLPVILLGLGLALPSTGLAGDVTGPLGRSHSTLSSDRGSRLKDFRAQPGTTIENDREVWQLRQDRLDRDRVMRSFERSQSRVASRAGNLRDPAFAQPWTRDIRGEDRRLGTAKLFVQLGRLLDSAQIAIERNRPDEVTNLASRAAKLRHVLQGVAIDDPNIAVRRKQYEQIFAWLSSQE